MRTITHIYFKKLKEGKTIQAIQRLYIANTHLDADKASHLTEKQAAILRAGPSLPPVYLLALALTSSLPEPLTDVKLSSVRLSKANFLSV